MAARTDGFLLGFDVGSSSIKAALLNAETGELAASASSPAAELAISAPHPGWAEQDPALWWDNAAAAAACLKAAADFNRHGIPHLLRASQEGIVFALQYGMKIMRDMGIRAETVRAGNANMFLSPIFREAFATVTGAHVELYNTDGARRAAPAWARACTAIPRKRSSALPRS